MKIDRLRVREVWWILTMPKHEYTNEQISEALAVYVQQGGNAAKTLKELGRRWKVQPGRKTLERWMVRMDAVEAVPKEGPAVASVLEQKKALFLRKWGEILLLTLATLKNKLGGMEAKDLSRLAGIATDKLVILREGKRSSDAYGRAPGAGAQASASASASIIVGAEMVAEARKELIDTEIVKVEEVEEDMGVEEQPSESLEEQPSGSLEEQPSNEDGGTD